LALPDKPSIAVLPFVDLSRKRGRDYFIHGLMEDITVALGREKWLFVIASPSAAAAGDASTDPRDIGAKLGIRYLLRGSVRIDGRQVLFVVQLHDAVRGGHIWSERFQDQLDNLFAVQNRLTAKVAAMIAPALVSVEVERAIHKPTGSRTARDLYLRALPLFRTSRDDNREAVRLLYRAIELDPSYATAYGLAARCFQFQRMFDWLPEDGSGLAEGARLARLAGERGPNDSEALWMAGLAMVHLSDEIDHSLALIERSLSLNPNSANAWIAACLIRSYLGDTNMAIDAFQRAQRLNPLDLSQHLHWNTIAWAYLGAGRYAEAAEAADRTLHISPAYLPGLRLKMVTSALLGRGEEARAMLKRVLAVQPRCSLAWMRQFFEWPLQKNPKAFEVYLAAARSAGVPER
jgi:TolB-like protein